MINKMPILQIGAAVLFSILVFVFMFQNEKIKAADKVALCEQKNNASYEKCYVNRLGSFANHGVCDVNAIHQCHYFHNVLNKQDTFSCISDDGKVSFVFCEADKIKTVRQGEEEFFLRY